MTLKTRRMKKILEPIEVQMRKLKLLLEKDNVKAADVAQVQSVAFDQLKGLAEKFSKLSVEEASDYKEMKSKISGIIEEFSVQEHFAKLTTSTEDQHNEDPTAAVLQKLTESLKTLENLECLPMKQQLRECCDYVEEMGATRAIEDFQNIKELGTFIVEIFGPLQQYRKNLISPLLGEKMAVYTCQLCAAFEMLVEVVQEQHQIRAPIYPAKKYACDRLCWCFKMIIDVLDAPNPTEEEENFDKENHFVYKMDLALDIIASMSGKSNDEQIKICQDLWSGIEELFSHALAIALLCQPENFKAIMGSTESIISKYENLKAQLLAEKPDPTLNNLFMNTLNDALYRLEHKVNVSVLTMAMEAFCEPFTALRRLIMCCRSPLTDEKRSKSDLDIPIGEFDLITDQIMQIGMFAIACCRDTDRVAKLKNCLASVESLEAELVPSIVKFYLCPSSEEYKTSLKLITEKWQRDLVKVRTVINLIIDSAAYSQVILDDLQERFSQLEWALDNRQGVDRVHVHRFVQRALVLSNQVAMMFSDVGSDKIDRQTDMLFREFRIAIYEADSACKKLLGPSATDSEQLRVVKRCELVLNVVKRLQPALVAIMNSSIPSNTSYGKPGMGQGDSLHETGLNFSSSMYRLSYNEKSVTYIRTPYTVKNCKPPLSIEPADSTPRPPAGLSALIPYIKRGGQLRSERSIMYKTPRKSELPNKSIKRNDSKMKNLSCVRQHLFSRESFISQNGIDLTSQSLELTAILDKLTGLSDTLSSFSSAKSPSTDPRRSRLSSEGSKANAPFNASTFLANLDSSFTLRSPEQCSTIGGGDAPSSIATPERVNDIQRLGEKIENLQKQTDLH